MTQVQLRTWVRLFWALNMIMCCSSPALGGGDAGPRPRVDVRFRASAALDDPLRLLPDHLRAPVTGVSPLITLPERDRKRIGAEIMGRWFRLELAAGTNAAEFANELAALDVVEAAERAPSPAPAPEPGG